MKKLSAAVGIVLTLLPNAYAADAGRVQVDRGTEANTKHVDMPMGKAVIVHMPQAAKEVIVADPGVVDAVIRTANRLYLFPKKIGQTNVFFFGDNGKQQNVLEINVGPDVQSFEQTVREVLPTAQIKTIPVGSSLLVSGTVRSAADAATLNEIAGKVVGPGSSIINKVGISGQEQVTIKVKVAEMNRTISKQLGVDWNTVFKIGNQAVSLATQGGKLVPGTNGIGGDYLLGNALPTSVNSAYDTTTTNFGTLKSFAPGASLTGAFAALSGELSKVVSGRSALQSNFASVQTAADQLGNLNPTSDAYTAAQSNLQAAVKSYNAGVGQLNLPSSALIDSATANDSTLLNNRNAANLAYANNKYTALTQKLQDLQHKIDYSPTFNRNPQRSFGLSSSRVAADAALSALEKHGLVKTLAEPTLTAISGTSAKFQAGGEFGYSTYAGTVGNGVAVPSVAFKPYGISLSFTPTVLSDNRINLKVSTELSALGDAYLGQPSLTTRNADTVVELPSGGTMALAGLLQENDSRSLAGVPGVRELPILGPLTDINDYSKVENEMVILATPYLVKPAHESVFKLPTDGYAPPSDADLYLSGNMSGVYDDRPPPPAEKNPSSAQISE